MYLECNIVKNMFPKVLKRNYIGDTDWCRPTEKIGTRLSFLLTPAVYLSTAFIILSAPFSYCQPPIPAASAFSQFTGPPMVVCQIPALDMLHHSAGVSGVNCHFVFPVLFMGRGGEKHRNTLRVKRHGQSCQPAMEIIRLYTCWETCNISVVTYAATICKRTIKKGKTRRCRSLFLVFYGT